MILPPETSIVLSIIVAAVGVVIAVVSILQIRRDLKREKIDR